MKKIIYSLIGITALAFALSCEKEQELPKEEAKTVAGNENPEVLPANIPATITASLVDTKTSYDETGAFSWTIGENGDHIYLMFYKEDTHYQGWVEYKATSADANGKAVFTIVSNQGDRISALADYTNSGVAVYGAGSDNHVARPYSANAEACILYKPDGEHTVTYDPFLTLRKSLTGASSEVVLLGTGVGDTDSNTGVFTDYHFYTACAVLKVTVSRIPNNAKELRLCTADKVNYPLHGDFAITYIRAAEKPIAPELTKDSYRQYKSSGSYWDSSSSYVAAACDGSSTTQTFYFNVPTGEYPANTLSIQLVDNNDNELLKKTITANYTFNRNDLVPASFDNEWVTLGVGRFIDNFLWAKIVAKGLDKDIPDYVNVTIQQNSSNTNKFRLVNPYGAAATQFGYVSANAASRDDYLEFTVAGPTSGAAVTDFTTHRTGFTIDGYDYNPELVYPTTYGEGKSTAQNKVLVGDESLPKIVQFAPAYHYNGYEMSDSYTYPRFDRKGIFRIIFPGVTNYGGSLSLPANGDAQLNKLEVVKQSNPGRIRGFVSQYTDYQIASDNYSVSASVSTGANGTCTWNNTGLATNTTIPSGPVYLTWYTADSNSLNEYYDQGRTKVYFINKTDYDTVIKQHTTSGNKGTSSDGSYTGSYTFAVSDNPATGNIMMTEFDGMTADVTGMDLASTHQIYSSLYWIAPGTTTYTGADPVFANGTAQYGVLSGSSILLNASLPFFKRGSVNVYVYSYTDYAGGGRGAANTPERFKFTISAEKVNVGETYVNARFDGNSQASAPYANTIVEN